MKIDAEGNVTLEPNERQAVLATSAAEMTQMIKNLDTRTAIEHVERALVNGERMLRVDSVPMLDAVGEAKSLAAAAMLDLISGALVINEDAPELRDEVRFALVGLAMLETADSIVCGRLAELLQKVPQ